MKRSVAPLGRLWPATGLAGLLPALAGISAGILIRDLEEKRDQVVGVGALGLNRPASRAPLSRPRMRAVRARHVREWSRRAVRRPGVVAAEEIVDDVERAEAREAFLHQRQRFGVLQRIVHLACVEPAAF